MHVSSSSYDMHVSSFGDCDSYNAAHSVTDIRVDGDQDTSNYMHTHTYHIYIYIYTVDSGLLHEALIREGESRVRVACTKK